MEHNAATSVFDCRIGINEVMPSAQFPPCVCLYFRSDWITVLMNVSPIPTKDFIHSDYWVLSYMASVPVTEFG